MTNHFNATGTPQYSQFIHLSRYSRWLEEEGRRETWEETTKRYIDFFANRFPQFESEINELHKNILDFEVMPSMRCLMTAGKALERDEVSGYNCSFLAIDHQRAFDEMMYILMCGCGVGYSVERQYIAKLPEIAETFHDSDTTIVVPDSKIGWATSYRELISLLYSGKVPKWDLSRLRPAGARLKTFGGRSSGPGPLDNLFKFTANIFKRAAGRKLNSLECHDLACKIGDIVVVGGVRRSALISLSNLSDDRMRTAKSGQWWVENGQRKLANNSACYTEKPELEIFMKEWLSLYESKSGERGIFNRTSAKKQAMKNGRRDIAYDFSCNPCSEIILRNAQFCNLSEVVARSNDTLETLKEKARIAAIFGTLQSSLTDFKYLRKAWTNNTKEERLLGVSITGIMDHKTLSNPENPHLKRWLYELKEICVQTNKEWSEKLGIEQSTAITCVKPSGCRPWNGLVTTTDGILTLEDFMDNHDSLTDWHDVKDIVAVGAGKVTKSFINGESPVLSIKMSFGMEVESTPNHKWYVQGKGWVRADEIKVEDQIEVNCGTYESNKECDLLSLNPKAIQCRARANDIIQPKTMNADLAWLLGYLWGDGAMSPSRYRLRWVDQRDSNLKKTQRILKEQFNISSSIKDSSGDRDARILEVGSKTLWHWLIKNGVWKYYKDNLDIMPLVVRKSSKESIIAFLGGLIDADGWASDKKLTYTTAHYEFSKHIQHVAWTVGIALGRSKNVGGQNLQQKKEMYLMALAGNTNNDSLDILVKHCDKAKKTLTAFNPQRIIRPGVVKSIVPVGLMPTFDVETAEHWFFAGSVRSHNTVSQLCNTASGIHARYSDFYVRNVRMDRKDPLCEFMKAKGFPYEIDVTNSENYVFAFPIKSPHNSITADKLKAMEALDIWKLYQDYWCEHKPSCTVYYTDDDFMKVGSWVWENFDDISGISFLPYSDHIYEQAPYQPISEDKYKELFAEMPKDVDWTELKDYEFEDNTAGSQTYACSGGSCEIVDLVKDE